MTSPTDDRLFRIVVIGEIILRDFDRQSRVFIAQILFFQRVRVIFGMPRYKYLFSPFGRDGLNAGFIRRREDLQFGMFFDVFAQNRRMAGMRNPELVVKAAQ